MIVDAAAEVAVIGLREPMLVEFGRGGGFRPASVSREALGLHDPTGPQAGARGHRQ
jgi:hypothetical protein